MTTAIDPAPESPTRTVPSAPRGLGKRALRNTVLILSARVLSRLVALITVVAISHALGDTRFGQMQTAVTYSALASIVADFGFMTLYVREGSRNPERLTKYLNFAMSARVLLSAISAPLLLAGLWFAGVQSLWVPTFALLFIGGYLGLLRNTLYATQRLAFEIAEIVPESLLLLGLVFVGVAIHGDTGWFLWAYAIDYAIAALYFLVVISAQGICRPRWDLDMSLARSWFRTGIPLAITYLLTTVYFKVDVPILQHFRSYDEVGWYTLAYKPFEALLFIPVTVRSVIFPVLSIYKRTAPARVLSTAEKLFKALLLLGLPLSVGVFLLSAQFNDLLQLYPQSGAALHILALALVFAFVDNTFAATFTAIDMQRVYAYIALVGLGINIVLNLVMIPLFGYIGASWSTVVTEVALVAIGWSVLRARVGTLHVLRTSWRVLPAAGVMGVFLVLMNPHGRIAVVLVTAAAAIVYGICLVTFRSFDAEDWQVLGGVARRRSA